MGNRKGFTLIELIAVVVIMAIIALLATPNIIGLLENGKKEEFVADAKEFISKASYQYRSEKFNNDQNKPKSYKLEEINGVTDDDLVGPWGKEYSKDDGVSIDYNNGTITYKITLTTDDKSHKTYKFDGVKKEDINIDNITVTEKGK